LLCQSQCGGKETVTRTLSANSEIHGKVKRKL
jgi:hypothetical protein